MEQSPRLLQAAPKYVGRDSDRTTCVCVGLQVRVSTLCARCVLLFTGWAQAVPPFGGSTYARIALVPKTVSTYYCRSSSRCAFVLGAYRDRSWKLQCIGLAVLRWSWKYGGQTVLGCLTRKVLLLTTTAVCFCVYAWLRVACIFSLCDQSIAPESAYHKTGAASTGQQLMLISCALPRLARSSL